ncbi:MAG: Two-component transcriptional response regulator, LuxR family [uncultured Chloroflexia bacterium]|uniref:Two-component transcriptional response regulator, LuxR family n=1 Tax=uncultured Chloroflexia bacterium TaxID=1672391 RepID=A0A6J4MRH3_9CHLR|nr:MAG: Two-component transcriptional response regulator, LuxR family [uncultured Chloroflexia bacterium]
MKQRIRVLIVDDHPIVRAGIEGILLRQDDIEVVGEATTGAEAVVMTRDLVPDVVLMDLRMPEMDGVEAIKQIKRANEDVHVLVLTTYDSDADILRAVEAGATGYLLKDTPRDDLFRAIRAAARGESVLAPVVATRLMSRVRTPGEDMLSNREIEVLRIAARGASNKEIAKQLWISEATVKSHLIHIFAKLGVADRTAAVMVGLERGMLRLDP